MPSATRAPASSPSWARANVSIGGDLDLDSSGGSANIDLENAAGTVFIGGNLNVGLAGAAVLTVGPSTTVELDNGGINAGANFVLNLYTGIDPLYSDGGTDNVKSTQTQSYPAYVAATAFDLTQGVTYTLDTPTIYGASGFTIGGGSSDTAATELILNADTFSADSAITFAGTIDTLVVGIDQLATIDVPPSGTGGFTKEANPNLGLPLIGGFAGVIDGFAAHDTIVVDTRVAATFSQDGSIVSVIANTTTLGVLTFASVAAATVAATTAGALVDQVVPCFAAGTRIATARGAVAVEAIGVGERVRVVLGGTAEGPAGEAFAPVIWVGRRQVDCARHARPRKVWPVRVAAGAFGPGLPHADLWLSPDHAVYVNEVLIPVRYLVNGSTIAQVKVDSITYHHIELAQHDVLLAEGLPAESFLDMKDGSNYGRGSGAIKLYPDFTARMWEAFGCAPLIVTGPELEAARALVASFAEAREAA